MGNSRPSESETVIQRQYGEVRQQWVVNFITQQRRDVCNDARIIG